MSILDALQQRDEYSCNRQLRPVQMECGRLDDAEPAVSHQHSAVQRVEVLREARVLFIDDDIVHHQTWSYYGG